MNLRIRKILCLLWAMLLILSAAGCALETPVETTTQPPETTPPTTEPPTTEPPTTAHVHNYVEAVIEPSCVEGGYTEFYCDGCEDMYTDLETEALGHDYLEEVIEVTEEAPGYTLHSCTRCGDTWQDAYTWLAETPTDFFDDAAFIGDSITLGLRNFCNQYGWLGDATFLCQGSYSVDHAVNNTMYIRFRGENMTPQQALSVCGAKKVFILLGMNDIALYGVDATLEKWGILLGNIRETCPDIAIYIQSGTPIYTAGQVGGLNNARMDQYNERLKVFAEENNCVYLDVGTAMKDENNGLAYSYASDNYVHLTLSACKLWAEQLKNYLCQGE